MKFKKGHHMKSQNGSVHVVLIAVLVVALIGTLGYVYWNSLQSKEADTSNTMDTSKSVEAYKRTSTVPNTWKKYNDETQGISFSYPSNWTVIPNSKGNPDKFNYEIGMGPWKQQFAVMFGRHDIGAGLEKYVGSEVKWLKDNGRTSVVNTQITIDGHQAREVSYKQSDGTQEKAYYVASGSSIWNLPLVYMADSTTRDYISAEDSLILFESIQIK
jgi:hypothetical protein